MTQTNFKRLHNILLRLIIQAKTKLVAVRWIHCLHFNLLSFTFTQGWALMAAICNVAQLEGMIYNAKTRETFIKGLRIERLYHSELMEYNGSLTCPLYIPKIKHLLFKLCYFYFSSQIKYLQKSKYGGTSMVNLRVSLCFC